MKFLKKVSFSEIIGMGRKHSFFGSTAEKFKNFELFLSASDLEKLLTCKKEYDEFMDALFWHGAEINAVHCPESFYHTSCDTGNISTNYLSICEAVHDDKSFRRFQDTLVLADRMITSMTGAEKESCHPINVIIHDGCIYGCRENAEKLCLNKNTENLWKEFKEKLEKIKDGDKFLENLKHIVVAVENITPYTDCGPMGAGKNCGWNQEDFFGTFHGFRFAEAWNRERSDKDLQFGVCIDFCHVLASYQLYGCNGIRPDAEAFSKAAATFFEKLTVEQKNLIRVFHLSYYGEDGRHGQLFPDDSIVLVDTLRQLCRCPETINADITLELEGGQYTFEASERFYSMVLEFSRLHKMGSLGRLLTYRKDNSGKMELGDFMEQLFLVYSLPIEDIVDITEASNHIKRYVIEHTNYLRASRGDRLSGEKKKRKKPAMPFGFLEGSEEQKLPIFRMKCYLMYTRFCLFGEYLAKNYYGDDCIIDKARKPEDFSLAMQYFMFNDLIGIVSFQGIAYMVNADLFPQRRSYARFYDGVSETDVTDNMQAALADIFNNADNAYIKNHPNCAFSVIGEALRNQINGDNIILLSFGYNLGQLMYKYYQQPGQGSEDNWTLMVYENMPVNYITVDGEVCSIPAFLQANSGIGDADKIKALFQNRRIEDFAVDLSKFRKGREDRSELSDTLQSFFELLCGKGIVKERAGSVSDGEAVFCKIPPALQTTGVPLDLIDMLVFKSVYYLCRDLTTKDHREIEAYLKAGYTYLYSELKECEPTETADVVKFDYQWKDIKYMSALMVPACRNTVPDAKLQLRTAWENILAAKWTEEGALRLDKSCMDMMVKALGACVCNEEDFTELNPFKQSDILSRFNTLCANRCKGVSHTIKKMTESPEKVCENNG